MNLDNTPIERWSDGSLRIKGTRIPIELLINSYKQGVSVYRIYDALPGDYELEDVSSIISFYLTNKSSVERYLVMRRKHKRKVAGFNVVILQM